MVMPPFSRPSKIDLLKASLNRLVHPLVLAACFAICSACKPREAKQGAPSGAPPTHVVAVPAKRQSVSEILPLVGTVNANEMVEIKPESDGIIQEINYQEGQRIEKGHLLLSLDDSKLAASVAEAEANFRLSLANHNRAAQLLKDQLISQQEFDQVAANFAVNQAGLDLKRRLIRDARIIAPFSGVVGARNVSPGQVVNRSTTLASLVDLDTVKVEVDIPEKFLSQVKIGQNLSFSVAAYPDELFVGQIYFIAPQVSETLRTAPIKARIPNPKHLLRPGMFASLELTLTVRESAIVIPDVAIINNGDIAMVFVIGKDDIANLRPVVIGERLAGKAEVRKGLTEGEEVVVEGHQKVIPGFKVKRSGPEKAAVYTAP